MSVLVGGACAQPTLKEALQKDFLIGTALDTPQITGHDEIAISIAKAHFNAITPGNDLKWERIHPQPHKYDFKNADLYVTFGQKNKMYTVGHVLVWHQQTPSWVFYDSAGKPQSRDGLLDRLHEHIQTVVGRYKGKINAWDVVNEVVGDDGRMRQTGWSVITGREYILRAFQWAHEADPDAELIYNDYNIEMPYKRPAALALVRWLKAQGAPITTVGIQGHYLLNEPDLRELDEAISAFGSLGVKVAITELDIDVLPRPGGGATADVSLKIAADPKFNPYTKGIPDDVQNLLTARYAKVFEIAIKHKDIVNRVTLWGVTDADSWHNNWPIKGRTAYSLLFDRDGNPKPAVSAILIAAENN